MRRWNGLFFKEWKLMRGFIFTAGLIGLASGVLASTTPRLDIISAAVILGFTIPPFYVLYSLNSEANQLDGFLHQPVPARRLLLVKIGMGLLLSVVYVLITSSYMMLLSILRLGDPFDSISFMRNITEFSLSAWVVSLYPTGIILFLWTVYRLWRAQLGNIAIGMIIGLLILGNAIMNLIRDSFFYQVITHWGEYSIRTGAAKEAADFVSELHVSGTFYFGAYICYGVLVIIYFWISCWLLDRKVGV